MALIANQISLGTHNITIGISSGGGDTSAAFGVYNSLIALENQNPHTKITMVNIGEVASAAVVIFCAGNERYSLPNANFMIHGNGMDIPPSHLEASMLKNTLDLINSMNEQTIRIISNTTKKNKAEIEAAVSGQVVLSSQQAKDWNLIQDIRQSPAPPDARVLTVNVQPEETKTPQQVTSISETR
jgi:ATP-dependent Clp protease, protease subunit